VLERFLALASIQSQDKTFSSRPRPRPDHPRPRSRPRPRPRPPNGVLEDSRGQGQASRTTRLDRCSLDLSHYYSVNFESNTIITVLHSRYFVLLIVQCSSTCYCVVFCPAEAVCPEGRFQCLKSLTCVPLRQVCDGYSHCPDNSDETTDCSSMSPSCFHTVTLTATIIHCHPTTAFTNIFKSK